MGYCIGGPFVVQPTTCPGVVGVWPRAPGVRSVQHRLVGLLRQSVYSRLAGYEDTNDVERLSDDPTMRVIVGRRGDPERPAARTNTMSRLETEVLTQDSNVEGLGRVNAKRVDGAMSRTPHRRVILDMDSSDRPEIDWLCRT